MPKQLKPVRIEGDLAYIPLSHGREAVIDLVDLPLVCNWNWYLDTRKHTSYAQRRDGRRLHRIIAGHPHADVDHRDRDGLNNRRSNLRVASRSQNLCNRGATAANISGYKGVHWHPPANKWRASISLHGKSFHIGVFANKADAAVAYAEASKRLHGEFGRTAC